MRYTRAMRMAELGANIIIAEDSRIQFSDALNLVEIVTKNGGSITIEKAYHHTEIEQMVAIAANKITIKV